MSEVSEQQLPEPSSSRSLKRRNTYPEVRTPENIETVGLIADKIQGVLEEAYGLESLKLKKASNFLYPRATSETAEKAIPLHGDNGAFYVDDGDPSFHANMASFHRKPLAERIRKRTKQVRSEVGLLPFERLNPVIYIGPSIMDRIKDAQLEDLLTEERLPDLEALSEEVGHFLYHQSQFKHNKDFPGAIMPEAMSLVDWYQALKRIVPVSTGKEIFDTTNHPAQAAVRNLSEKISLRVNAPSIHLNPITSMYSKGPRIIRGYLEHLIKNDRSGIAQGEELKKFYLLTGERKIQYLTDLYQRYVDQGDKEYNPSLAYVRDSMPLEPEFGRRFS